MTEQEIREVFEGLYADAPKVALVKNGDGSYWHNETETCWNAFRTAAQLFHRKGLETARGICEARAHEWECGIGSLDHAFHFNYEAECCAQAIDDAIKENNHD